MNTSIDIGNGAVSIHPPFFSKFFQGGWAAALFFWFLLCNQVFVSEGGLTRLLVVQRSINPRQGLGSWSVMCFHDQI